MVTYAIIGGVVLILFYFVFAYNKLVRLRNFVEEAWSGVDVQLKKRYNLIPNLVNTVKGYAKHEKEIFTEVTEKRSQAMAATTVDGQRQAENALSQALMKVLAVAENYPDLKANANFLSLQGDLRKIEEDIEMARRYYNGATRNMNNMVEQFPSMIVANVTGFKKRDYFEIENAVERENVNVQF